MIVGVLLCCIACSHGAERETIPVTLIPKEDHILIKEFQVDEVMNIGWLVSLAHDQVPVSSLYVCLLNQAEAVDWEFDPTTKLWTKTAFPSRRPAGRQEVLVSRCCDCWLAN